MPAESTDHAATWQREPHVLWRLGPDRVVVRVTGGESLDLVGAAALVWIALDAPRERAGLVDEISSVSTDMALQEAIDAALRELLGRQLVRKSS